MIQSNSFENDKVYLNVPYTSKEIAKENGAKWDQNMKKWYLHKNIAKSKLQTLLSLIFAITVPKYITTSDPDELSTKEKMKLHLDWKKDEIMSNYDDFHKNTKNSEITRNIFNC